MTNGLSCEIRLNGLLNIQIEINLRPHQMENPKRRNFLFQFDLSATKFCNKMNFFFRDKTDKDETFFLNDNKD